MAPYAHSIYVVLFDRQGGSRLQTIWMSVESMSCEVTFGLEVFSLPTILLQKNFSNMSIVCIPSISGLSLVLATDLLNCSTSVLLNNATVQQLEQQHNEDFVTHSLHNRLFTAVPIEPIQSFTLNSVYNAPSSTAISNISSSLASMMQLTPSQNSSPTELPPDLRTRRAPWMGTHIIVTKHPMRKGYQGVVLDVQRDDSCISGLAVYVHYNVVTAGDKWLDLNLVRNAESLQFLHDSKFSGLDNYYCFRSGYTPTYTSIQSAAILTHDVRQCANLLFDKVIEADAKEYKMQLRGLLLLDPPLLDKWILSPVWHLSLHDLEFNIIIHHGPHASPRDQLVYLVLSDGRLQVRMSLNQKDKRRSRYVEIHAEDICNIPPGGMRTNAVSQKGYNARGLYLIADADKVSLHCHVSRLVHRVSDVACNDTGNLITGDGMYLVQRVNLCPLLGQIGYDKEVMVEEELFVIHYLFLLLVHLSATLNAAGNKKMYKIRTKHGGWTLLPDEPDSEGKIQNAKWKKAEVVASVGGLAERIERAQLGRHQTPPPPPQPGPVD
ncbi:hypothetical protein GYMLUDRAFT_249219 [Collybiopsis luxurians FD-317 M1]|uniref:Uncharacterized protein n=1 Tax=Collybiopsis luxurians FD-317 M1 TaxID=944289 RepID=A0A0D0CI95_9AGAR|nr:hypothetical protein GYMLUDRAFT_249219 [Collybiopsis luxurians FD-317 M1]